MTTLSICLFTFSIGLLIWHFAYRHRTQKNIKEIQEKLRSTKLLYFQKAQQSLSSEMEEREAALRSIIELILRKNHFQTSIQERLKSLVPNVTAEKRLHYNKIVKMIELESNTKKDWEKCMSYFQEIHHRFYQHLVGTFPDLSFNDWRLIILLKLEYSTKEIAALLNISTDGVKKARYRLRKKLGVSTSLNISEFIQQVA